MSRAMLSEPSSIFAEIEAQPPLMRAEVSQRYLGEEIDWLLTFTKGRELDAGRAWLTFDFDPRSIKMIVGEVGLAEYPQLRMIATRRATPRPRHHPQDRRPLHRTDDHRITTCPAGSPFKLTCSTQRSEVGCQKSKLSKKFPRQNYSCCTTHASLILQET